MKTLMTTLTMTLMSLLLTNGAFADAADDVRVAEMDSRAQEKAGNADGVYDYMVPDFSIYPPTARLVSHGWDEDSKKRMRARHDSGRQFDFQVRHLDIKVYGDAAVSTYYLVGPVLLPDGERQRQSLRMTSVWIKQAGQWKLAHRHESPLKLP
jgi:ketosteroid isomerase-like protein